MDNNNIMKLVNLLLMFILLFSLQCDFTSAQDYELNIYFFWAEGCPHCTGEKLFLTKLEQKYSNIDIHRLEVTKNKENAELLMKIGKELNVDISGVPFTVIGDKHFIGWYDEETTGKAIEEAVQCAIKDHCTDIVSGLITPITQNEQALNQKTIPKTLNLPLLGEIETKNLSLPILTILIGGLDGFNPCAMWVLLFLISLLLGMENRKKMWVFGAIFIAASAFVYFMFMATWLNVFLFLGFIFWVRLSIGGIALWAGYYNLKEYITNPLGVCKVTGGTKRQKVFNNLKRIIQEKHFMIAFFGLIILAFAVNLVELICSAGLPAVYTQILSLNNLVSWQYYLYLILYIFIFMLDDLVVFIVAMITLQLTGISTKYSRYSHLIGGIILLIIGVFMIFKPELLMFG